MAPAGPSTPEGNPSHVRVQTVETSRPPGWRSSQLYSSNPEEAMGGDSQQMGKSPVRRPRSNLCNGCKSRRPNMDSKNLPSSHTNVKLKLLIEELFERILPHGVCQLIQVPTHAQQGVATKCLDHLYTTNPEKLSDISVEFTGMSYHKLIKVLRYSKTLKSNPRYV